MKKTEDWEDIILLIEKICSDGKDYNIDDSTDISFSTYLRICRAITSEFDRAKFHGLNVINTETNERLNKYYVPYHNKLSSEYEEKEYHRLAFYFFLKSMHYAFYSLAEFYSTNLDTYLQVNTNWFNSNKDIAFLAENRKEIEDAIIYKEIHPEFNKVAQTITSQINKLATLNQFNIPSPSYKGELERISQAENKHEKNISMEWVVNNFLPMTLRISKNKKPYLSEKQLVNVLKIAFLNESGNKVTLNFYSANEARIVHLYFRNYYEKMKDIGKYDFKLKDLYEIYSKCIKPNGSLKKFTERTVHR